MHHCTIAIIWGSFAGLSAYIVLRKRLWKEVNIKLFDKRTHFTYTPGLHECIADTDRLSSLQFSFAQYYKQDYVHGDITAIRPHHEIQLADGTLWTFDHAIIATWSRPQFFGKQDREQYGYTRRYPEDVAQCNNKLHEAQSIAVVWWGITGIEVATMLKQRVPEKDIHLVHSRDRVLDHMDTSVSDRIDRYMDKQGIIRHYGKRLQEVHPWAITLNDGSTLHSDLTIISVWVAAEDAAHEQHMTFDASYICKESPCIAIAWDVAMHGLAPTAHNAMIEGRRMWHRLADTLQGTEKTYPPLHNRETLAVALWAHDGVFTYQKRWVYIPYLTGLAKWFIEKRVMLEFKHKILLPI